MRDAEILELIDAMIKTTKPSLWHRFFYSGLSVLLIFCITQLETISKIERISYLALCVISIFVIWISYFYAIRKYKMYYDTQIAIFRKLLSQDAE